VSFEPGPVAEPPLNGVVAWDIDEEELPAVDGGIGGVLGKTISVPEAVHKVVVVLAGIRTAFCWIVYTAIHEGKASVAVRGNQLKMVSYLMCSAIAYSSPNRGH